MSDTGAMRHLQSLIDEPQGVETVRALRGPAGVRGPTCEPSELTKQGHDETQPARQRDRCQSCGRRVDDVTDTILAGHQQPRRVWMRGLDVMGRHRSNAHMAHARDRHQDAGQHMTWQRRHGRVATKPTPTVEGAVACDAVDSVAGHQGKPEAVAKRGGAGDADGSRARGDAARLPQRHHRVAG